MSAVAAKRPEWVDILNKQIEENPKFTSYALSTLSVDGKPKVRYVVHRGITPGNILLTTTDSRMQKPVHLSNNPILEIAWWIDDAAVQFRITGEGYPIPSPKAENGAQLIDTAVKALGSEGAVGREGNAEYWEGKRVEMWEKEMSGHLRGSFGRPNPGKKLSEIKEKPEDWISRLDASSDDPTMKKDIEFALSNFALLAVRPTAVEFLELKPTPNKRTQWQKQSDGDWERVEVAP